MNIIKISDEDLKKLKDLLAESSTYYDRVDENGETEPWDLEDVDGQLEIANEIYAIISPLIKNL